MALSHSQMQHHMINKCISSTGIKAIKFQLKNKTCWDLEISEHHKSPCRKCDYSSGRAGKCDSDNFVKCFAHFTKKPMLKSGFLSDYKILLFLPNELHIKPEDHWSRIVHLSAEAMLKSVVIEEKKKKLLGRGRQPIRAKIFMSTGRPHHYGNLLQV